MRYVLFFLISIPVVLYGNVWEVYVDNDQIVFSGTQWEDIPDMVLNVTINPGEGNLLYFSMSNIYGNPPYGPGSALYFRIIRDTTVIIRWKEWDREISGSFNPFNTTIKKIDNPGPGTYTYKVQWQCAGHYQGVTQNCIDNAHRYFASITSVNFTEVSENKTKSVPGENNLFIDIKPNPTSNNVIIEFNLPSTQKVSIHIIDAQGRIVTTLVEHKMMTAGKNVISWNTKGILPDGVYFISLSTNDGKQIKKSVILK